MRRAQRGLVAALLLLAATPAAAEWLKLEERAGGFLYYDPETVAKEGVIRRLFTLQDRKTPEDNGVLSRRAQWEFNCKESQVRLLAFRSYADQMGIGKVIVRDNVPGPWEPVVPKTTHETLLRLTCAR